MKGQEEPGPILSLGSNLGNRVRFLEMAKEELGKIFEERKASAIYESAAVDYIQQPPFLNQLIEYKKTDKKPNQILDIILEIEKKFGRTRDIRRGPRTLDIDLIFLGELEISSDKLQVPHPRWIERSFIYWPLHELPSAQMLKRLFFPKKSEVPNNLTPYKPG
ncbi:MAG: 2-amino-4-hydroxy-6-hydroxymethyldihydropteridine diphosphokinase [Bacteriovoracales bacterium]|nr:2-amino-4-hydroxy-6-hydroxymethyldihydropteridine diphosphokinase [Bacteriovoracales bacterium]